MCKRFLFAALLSILSVPSYGYFSFGADTYDVPEVGWALTDLNFEASIVLQSCFGLGPSGFFSCATFQSEERYSIWVVDQQDFTLAGPGGEQLEIARAVFEQNGQQLVLKDGSSFPVAPENALSPGSWNEVPATVNFTISAVSFASLPAGSYTGTIGLLGRENEGSQPDDDNTQLNLTVTIPPFVKISGLQDVALDSRDVSNGVLESDYDLCVFSNVGKVRLELDGACGPGNSGWFRLGQTGECNNNSNLIDYTLVVTTGNEGSREYQNSNDHQNEEWSASYDESCNGVDNMNFKVRVSETELSGKQAGIYSDTMTVIVSPAL